MAGSLLPIPIIVLDVPTWPGELTQNRLHNKFGKKAVRKALEYHLKEIIPKHFKRDARQRYTYKRRNPQYVRSKQFWYHKGGMDLVKTGKSRKLMPAKARIIVSGITTANTLQGRLKMRFPFPGGTGKRKKPWMGSSVSVAQMVKEMETITTSEKVTLKNVFRDEYFRLLNDHASKRKRKRRRIKA